MILYGTMIDISEYIPLAKTSSTSMIDGLKKNSLLTKT